ncbi:hypothetical protein [Oerskovia turbata]
MNDDELLVSRLRNLAGDDVPMPLVDRAEVLRRGRRRRVLRASGTTMGVGVLCAGLYLGAGGLGGGPAPESTLAPASDSAAPATGDEPPQDPSADPPATPSRAVVDETAGTVTLPLDEWFLSRQELAVVTSAREAYLARCMTDAGFGDTVELVGPVRDPSGNADAYGVRTVDSVEAAGYTLVPGYPLDYVVPRNQFRNGDAAVETQRSTCFGELRALGIDWDVDRFEEIAPTGWMPFAHSDEGRAVLAEWRQCLEDKGVTAPAVDSTSMIPPGALGASRDEQVRIGRIDVACKDDLDVVRRLADIDAAQQWEYIERARTYLEERRTVEQAALAASEAYLASQGLSMDDESW